MARGSSKTVVKRSRDDALEHVKVALRTKGCLFTKQEMSFIRTSCQILGVDSHATMRAIQDEVESNRIKQPRKVMEYLQTRMKELAEKVEKHKRPTPKPGGLHEGGQPDGSLSAQPRKPDGVRRGLEGGHGSAVL
jgi:hypothetical protein